MLGLELPLLYFLFVLWYPNFSLPQYSCPPVFLFMFMLLLCCCCCCLPEELMYVCVYYIRCGSYRRVRECERTTLQPDFGIWVLLSSRRSRDCALYWPHSIQLLIHSSSQQVHAWWISSSPVPVSTLLCLWLPAIWSQTPVTSTFDKHLLLVGVLFTL